MKLLNKMVELNTYLLFLDFRTQNLGLKKRKGFLDVPLKDVVKYFDLPLDTDII